MLSLVFVGENVKVIGFWRILNKSAENWLSVDLGEKCPDMKTFCQKQAFATRVSRRAKIYASRDDLGGPRRLLTGIYASREDPSGFLKLFFLFTKV
jgi:hypothetical protein